MDIPDMDDLLDRLENNPDILLPPPETFYPTKAISAKNYAYDQNELPNNNTSSQSINETSVKINEKIKNVEEFESIDGDGKFSIPGHNSDVKQHTENGIVKNLIECEILQTNTVEKAVEHEEIATVYPIFDKITIEQTIYLENLSQKRDHLDSQEKEYTQEEEPISHENLVPIIESETSQIDIDKDQDELIRQMAEIEEWINAPTQPIFDSVVNTIEDPDISKPNGIEITESTCTIKTNDTESKIFENTFELREKEIDDSIDRRKLSPDLIQETKESDTTVPCIKQKEKLEVAEDSDEYINKIVHEVLMEAIEYVEQTFLNTKTDNNSKSDMVENSSSSMNDVDKNTTTENEEFDFSTEQKEHNYSDESIEVIEIADIEITEQLENIHEECVVANDLPTSSSQCLSERRSVVASTHDISIENTTLHLTESELQLGKVKPYWIPDQDCAKCMLCQTRFNFINRRHHCRSCGRVLCVNCCVIRRALPYIGDPEKKQRICEPCSRTLDRIDEYEIEQIQKQLQNINNEASTAEENSHPVPGPSSESINPTVTRKKSVLKKRNEISESEANEADGNAQTTSEKPSRRSVVFRDGISPGEDSDVLPTTSSNVESENSSIGEASIAIRKVPKRNNLSSRRVRERRAEEEAVCLLHDDFVYLVNTTADLQRTSFEQLAAKLSTGLCVEVAIKRNLSAKIQLYTMSSYPHPVWFISTNGFFTIGVDELVLIYEVQANNSSNNDSLNGLPLDALKFYDRVFTDALSPMNESTDEKVGIRRCVNRIQRFFALPQGQLDGIEAAGIIFQRPYGQNFENLPLPTTPFLIGTFVKSAEIVWTMACYNRLLYRLGMNSSYYPFPILNERNRKPVYTNNTTNTVLKVFNDFKNWSYSVYRVPGSVVSLEDKRTKISIPSWMKDEIKTLVECNRSMICWVLDFNDRADSHFVCEENENASYTTHIFTNGEKQRTVTGATFVIFDGALKHSSEKFIVTVIEDGIVVRMQLDIMDEVVRCLLAGQNFHLESKNMTVDIVWTYDYSPKFKVGALVSPIDDCDISGKYQYGLSLNRQFRSMNPIPNVNEWALRLVSVINMDDGKFPLVLQPKYFDICEQIATQIAATLAPFVGDLAVICNRLIAIRIRIDSEIVTYDTSKWFGLEDEHFVWTVTLDDQMIPYLYNLCAILPSGFHVEMHMAIVSIKSIHNNNDV